MISSGFLYNIGRLVGLYSRGKFIEAEGRLCCYVCYRRNKGEFVGIDIDNEFSVARYFCHKECLDVLSDINELKKFILKKEKQIRGVNSKLSAQNN